MINEKVVIEEIPAAVILNNFISGEEDSNYEIFLLEYVNQSKYFQEKSMHEKYVSPKSESNGECDAISSHYRMDFKLLSSTSYLQALRMTSNSITNAIFMVYREPLVWNIQQLGLMYCLDLKN